LHLIRCG